MGEQRSDEPIKQVLALGAPYPMVVLPVDGEYWMEGNHHILSKDKKGRAIYPDIDMSHCTLHEDESVYNYRRDFIGKEHINYAGEDVKLGPILMSVLLVASVNDNSDAFHIILRLKNKTIFQVIPSTSIATDIPGPRDFMRNILGEEPQVDRFHPVAIPRASDEVIRFDEHTVTNCHKVGAMYQCFGQISEEDYLNNQEITPAFQEFMELISERVNLKDFQNYRGGLDVKHGQTGEYSYYTNFENREMMFHVSPLLPSTPTDYQQLKRKRHIGNDVVSIIFQDTNTPFCPSSFRSHVIHVFVVIQVENANTKDTWYKVSVTAKEGVPKFAPDLPNPSIFKKGLEFRKFILTKIINAEKAALKCEKFKMLMDRTRSLLLEQIVTDLITKNEKLLREPYIASNELPQKSNSFLSTFRSAWHRNGRVDSVPQNSPLKKTKNKGQSLSLNDLSLLETEDSKKDLKVGKKEKKKAKKERRDPANDLVSIKKTSSFNSEYHPSDYPNSAEFHTGIRPRSTYQVENVSKAFLQFSKEQSSETSCSSTHPRKLSAPKLSTSLFSQKGYSPPTTCNHDRYGDVDNEKDEAYSSSAAASAQEDILRLKAEVNKLKFDKMDLVRQNVIHQREIKRLNEQCSSLEESNSTQSKLKHRKEKIKSNFYLSPTEYV